MGASSGALPDVETGLLETVWRCHEAHPAAARSPPHRHREHPARENSRAGLQELNRSPPQPGGVWKFLRECELYLNGERCLAHS